MVFLMYINKRGCLTSLGNLLFLFDFLILPKTVGNILISE